MPTHSGRNRDEGDEGVQEDRQTDEDLDKGFDEEPDSVDTTSPVRRDEAVIGGPGVLRLSGRKPPSLGGNDGGGYVGGGGFFGGGGNCGGSGGDGGGGSC